MFNHGSNKDSLSIPSPSAPIENAVSPGGIGTGIQLVATVA